MEQSEYALYQIQQELELRNFGDVLIPLASVQDQERLNKNHVNLETGYCISCSAHKHVPLVEHNVLEGVKK